MNSSYLQRIHENSAYVRARLADIRVDIEKLKDERDALKAENAALRQALHKIKILNTPGAMKQVANAALESSTPKEAK